MEYADKVADIRHKSETKLPLEIGQQEFDALVAEIITPAMMKRGMSVQEVADGIIKASAEEMLANIEKRI